MKMFCRLLLWSLLLLPFLEAKEICTSPNNVFHARVDLFASELGHYMFEECGDAVNPTLGLEVGQTYTFEQLDRSNYFHPLEITSTPTTFFQGTLVVSRDVYKRRFYEPPYVWATYDEFTLQVQFDDPNVSTASYFCIIHHGMEGSIQLLQNGKPVLDKNQATAEQESQEKSFSASTTFQDNRSEFDKHCGTFGLGDFQLPNPLCPDRFVCGTDGVTEELQEFSDCLEAANCAMMSGMTTGIQATADSALFIHQMIPHHQNAVNTAKTLIKMGSLLCPDLTDQSNPDCVLEGILREIVANQNHQIQRMRQFLRDYKYPLEDNCDVFVETVIRKEILADDADETEDTTTETGRSGALNSRFRGMQVLVFATSCVAGLLYL